MPGVQRLQQIEGFPAAHLADDDAIRTMTQRGAEQVPNRDGRHVRLRAPAPRTGPDSGASIWSSAVSSIRTMRSDSGRSVASALRSVVLPVPVPPLIRMFSRFDNAVAHEIDEHPSVIIADADEFLGT